jgi:hypothetical protein
MQLLQCVAMHLVLSYNPKDIFFALRAEPYSLEWPKAIQATSQQHGAPEVLLHDLCGSFQAMGYELQACLQRTLSPLNGTASP